MDERSVTAAGGRTDETLPDVSVAGASRALPRSDSLFPLNNGRNGSPVFFIHPASGTSWLFQPLVDALDLARPIYGTRTPELDWHRDVLTLREMAAHYAINIRKVQPRGPYSLLGYSFGGQLAFEIARRLEAGGDAIRDLILLDVGAPASWRQRAGTRWTLLQRAVVRFLIRHGLAGRAVVRRVASQFPMAEPQLCFDAGPLRDEDVRLLLRIDAPDFVKRRNVEAMTLGELCQAFVESKRPSMSAAEWSVMTLGYDGDDAISQMKGATLMVKHFCVSRDFSPSGVFNGRMTIFRSTSNFSVGHWQRYASRPIRVIDVDATALRTQRVHNVFLDKRNVVLFAQQLRAVLETAGA